MLKSLMVSENSLAFSLSLIYLCLGFSFSYNSLGIFGDWIHHSFVKVRFFSVPCGVSRAELL